VRRHGRQTSLGPALDGVMRRLDRKSGGAYTSARVLLAWDRVAGEGIAKHTTGAHLREGTLVVYVDNNSWATQYTAMAETYRRSVNAELGEELVSALRFTVSRKVAEAHKIKRAEDELDEFYREDDVAPIALTPLERAQIEASVAEIPDEGLREAVLRATVKDLEWKKGLAHRNAAQERPQSV
jgi:hypothetical protein